MTRSHNLREVLALFRENHAGTLLAGALLAVATVIAGIALLGLSGWFITATAIAGVSVTTALAFDVFAPSAGIRLFALGRTATRYGERLTTHDGTFAVLAALRERIFRGYAKDHSSNDVMKFPSRLLFRITLDIDALDSLFLRIIVPLFAAVGAAIVTTVALGLITPLLGLIAGFLLLASGLGIPLLAARRARRASQLRAYALEALRARTIDLVRGQTDLLMTNQMQAQVDAITYADRYLHHADTELNKIEANASFGLAVSGSLLLAGILLAVAHLAEAGRIDAPVATLALLVGLAAIEPFTNLRRGAVELGRTLLATQRIGSRLTPHLAMFVSPIHPSDNSINLENVSLHHAGAAQPSLNNIDLHIQAGERVALIGPSGAGKSTLLSIIAGNLQPTHGSACSAAATMLTQQTQVFRDSLRGNLQIAKPQASDEEMLEVLKAVGLSELVESLPNGLGSELGEGGAGLSGGQLRRLALARLFLRDTPVWLFDEPTEGLDRETARDVLLRTYPLAREHTIVLATHLRQEAAIADRLIIMEEGRIVDEVRRGSLAFDRTIASLRAD